MTVIVVCTIHLRQMVRISKKCNIYKCPEPGCKVEVAVDVE